MARDPRLYAPATQRNRDPILSVLRRHLPRQGLVLEIASGSGEHVVHFATRLRSLLFQPSDPDPAGRASIDAWVAASGLENVRPALAVDASAPDWPVERADAVLNINMAHISPWSASIGLIEGAKRVLPQGGSLILYGPWLKDDIETAASNLAFDADLKSRDPKWGLRRVEDFEAAARTRGFVLVDSRQMPANNLMLLFRLMEIRHT
jgi:hypothetical protein